MFHTCFTLLSNALNYYLFLFEKMRQFAECGKKTNNPAIAGLFAALPHY